MEYRSLGPSGQKVSLLGFGCMRFPEKNKKIDEEPSRALLERALAGGVNYFDTAWVYHGGKSEDFVGRVLSAHPRDSYYLATKLPCWEIKSQDDARRIFEAQLERLRTDHIDFYLLHALNAGTWAKMEELGIWELCRTWKDAGRIRNLGFSFHDGYPAFERIITARDWDFCQLQYNYMDTMNQAGRAGMELAAARGVPVMVMEPLRGGSLARLPAGVAERLAKADAERGQSRTAASWAFRWVARDLNVKVILSGMTLADQLEDNLDTFGNYQAMDDGDAEVLAQLSREIESRVRNGCTACGYCLPCPQDVDIPGNFRIWNEWGKYEDRGSTRWQWHNPDAQSKRADLCTACGACVPRCPQGLDIPGDLSKAVQELEAVKRTIRI